MSKLTEEQRKKLIYYGERIESYRAHARSAKRGFHVACFVILMGVGFILLDLHLRDYGVLPLWIIGIAVHLFIAQREWRIWRLGEILDACYESLLKDEAGES